MKRLFQNRTLTLKSINDDINYLKKNQAGFKDLPSDAQLDLAMRFFQCRRGRLQKGKMAIDIATRLTPLILSILALMQAFK